MKKVKAVFFFIGAIVAVGAVLIYAKVKKIDLTPDKPE
jgi:hypothetical protein